MLSAGAIAGIVVASIILLTAIVLGLAFGLGHKSPPVVCSPTKPCSDPLICVSGTCVQPNVCTPPCTPPLSCVKGSCQATNVCTPACTPPLVCVNGSCQATNVCTPACTPPMVCVSGTCQSSPPVTCSPTNPCPSPLVCISSACLPPVPPPSTSIPQDSYYVKYGNQYLVRSANDLYMQLVGTKPTYTWDYTVADDKGYKFLISDGAFTYATPEASPALVTSQFSSTDPRAIGWVLTNENMGQIYYKFGPLGANCLDSATMSLSNCATPTTQGWTFAPWNSST